MMRQQLQVLAVCFLIAPACLLAQVADTETILIRNVLLLDRPGRAEDVVVNILIKDKKIDVVTRDDIPATEAMLAVDARNGVLLGKLHIGERPSFLILDKDPRENLEVLLDTNTHAHFAIHEGEVLKNTLQRVTEAESETAKRGWLAYTPPPMALPLSYLDNTKWNKWESKYISGIFIAAVILDRQRWISQDDASELQVGDLGEFDGGEIRGLRFGAAGTLNFKKPWVYIIAAATNAFDKGFDTDRDDDITIFDYRLDIPLPGLITLSVGKQKEPISMERIMSMINLPMQERSSVSDALLPSRNVGAAFSGSGFDRRMTWAGGVFNDAIDHGEPFNESSSQVVGRLTWLPFLTDDESNLIHLGLGVRYSDLKEGVQVGTEPEFNNSPNFVELEFSDADDAILYNLEVSWRKGSFWLAGEYVTAGVNSPELGDPRFSGHHITASWALTGEMRSYNRKSGIFNNLPVSKSVNSGGWGAWELGLRWSSLDLTEGAFDGGEMGIVSLGLNWWLTPTFSFNLNYRHIGLDRFGAESGTHGLNTRVMLMLE